MANNAAIDTRKVKKMENSN